MRASLLEREIPDAPTLEEFECLLGESPTNYPRGEGVENMESELHSAAIDTEVYEKESCRVEILETDDEIPTDECIEVNLLLIIKPIIKYQHSIVITINILYLIFAGASRIC